MTENDMPAGTDAEGVDWGGMAEPEAAATWSPEDYPGTKAAPSYPEQPDNPHNHRFTISFDGRGPMIVVRGNTRAEIIAGYNELDAEVGAAMGNSWLALKSAAQLVQGVGPVTPVTPQAPPPGLPQAPAPQGPPFGPNVSVPAAPGYQGPGAGQFPAPPPQQGWGGQQQGGGPQAKPRPAGWLMVDVPFNDKDRFKALRAQGTDSGNYLRGKVQWGGKGMYWLEPSIAQWVAQQGFPVTQ